MNDDGDDWEKVTDAASAQPAGQADDSESSESSISFVRPPYFSLIIYLHPGGFFFLGAVSSPWGVQFADNWVEQLLFFFSAFFLHVLHLSCTFLSYE